MNYKKISILKLGQVLSIILFICGLNIGIIQGVFSEYKSQKIDNKKLTEDNKIEILKDIIFNNLQVIIKNVLGFLSLGLLSILSVVYNGYICGFITIYTYKVYSLDAVFRHILPHLIEIIGITISAGIGISLSIELIKYLFESETSFNYKSYLYLFIISFCIIILAGFLETFISIN